MEVVSVVRQRNLVFVAGVFVLPLLVGLFFAGGALVGISGFGPVLVVAGAFLVLLSVVMITACLLSVTIRASVGPAGVVCGEVGARWSVPWSAVAGIWIVPYNGQQFLAVLPAPGAPKVRTAWRGRRMGLLEGTRTVPVEAERVGDLAAAIAAYRGRPPDAA